ncbi:hypothetical protein ADICYQ_2378 [Cyclobacterium qasimii M12-11B]|uniref:Uncharacterized protein n=1 Tax=Cyclobacterium qasimii M12-11B TaxID=641524 RepID=S7VE89_9BACT|nr:hypothetical protein ADICYQ_2378 [Cyclobacterium qasimii M12-11B]
MTNIVFDKFSEKLLFGWAYLLKLWEASYSKFSFLKNSY